MLHPESTTSVTLGSLADVLTLQPTGLRNQRRTHLPRSTRGWSRAIAWSLMGLTCFGVGFGTIARIDTSISATGKLRPWRASGR